MITRALVITPGTHFTLLSISAHLSQSPSYLPPGVIVRTKLTLSASQSEIVGGGETREGAGQGRAGEVEVEVGVGFIVIRCLTTTTNFPAGIFWIHRND